MDERSDRSERLSFPKKRHPWFDLRTGTFLTIVISTIFLAAFLSVLVWVAARQHIQQNISRQMLETTQQAVDQLDRGMFERYRDIQNAAAILSGRQLPPDETRTIIEQLRRTFADYSWIGFADVEGVVLVSTGQILEGEDVSGRPWFVEGLRGPFVGDVHEALLLEPLLPTEDGEPLRLVDIAFPVTDNQGQVAGVLGAHLNWQWARELRDTLLFPGDAEKQIELLILDAAGNVLLGPPDFEGAVATAVHEQIQSGIVENPIITAWPNGEQYLSAVAKSGGYREYPGLGWHVLARQPTAVAFASARPLSGQILALGTVLGLVFAAFGWVLAGRVVAPIQTIAAAARRIRTGDTSVTIPHLQSYDEVVTLADTVRDLLAALNKEIEEHKKIEEALRQSEARYRSLAESSGVGIWQITSQGDTLYINPAMCHLLGLEGPEALAGKTYHSFFTPESLETMKNHHARRAEGITSSYEVELIRSDNQRRHVIVYGAPVMAADGQLHSLIGTFVDVTESKQALASLMAEKNFTESAIDSLPGIFYLFDTQGRFLRWNKTFETVSGYGAAEMAELHPLDLFVGEDKALLEERIATAFETGAATVEADLVAKDGRRTSYFFTGKRVTLDETVCLVGMGIDVTERKKAEQELQRWAERLQLTLDNLTIVAYEIDADGTFLLSRGKGLEKLGLQPDEVVGVSLLDIYAEYPEIVAAARRALAGEEQTFEVTVNGVIWDSNFIPIKNEEGKVERLFGTGVDVTAYRQAEEALRRSEEQYRQLFENALVGIFRSTPDGRFLQVNPALVRMLGYDSVDEVLALDLAEDVYADPGQRAQIQAMYEPRGIFENVEVIWKRKDGEPITVRVYGRVVRDKQGDVVGYEGMVQDITLQKKAEEKLRQSEANLQAIFNNTLQAFILFDRDRRVQAANSVANNWARQVLGHPLQEGERADELFTQIQMETFGEAFSRALNGETVIQERRVEGTDREFWFETNYIPVKTEEGVVVGVSLSVLNVTERRQAEEALRQSKTELQYIIDTVPEGVLLLAGDGRIHLTNPVAEQYLAVLAPEWEDGRLTHLGNWPLLELLTSPPKGLWHELIFDDHTFEAIARPVEDGPENAGWVLVLRDMSQEREIQQRVQRQERMAAVGQLAAGVAHDFNNVMAVITLYTQLLSRAEELSPRAQEKLNTIELQAQRAADLIQQILDFSRQSVLERQPLDLLLFLKGLSNLLNRTLPEYIQVELNYGEEEYIIHADPSRLQQVIMNLAFNARDAMPEGGRLELHLARLRTEQDRRLPVRNMLPGDWVQIQVADTGSGIVPEMLPHIFEPFFTTKEVGQGTGLGLAQVYGIVQQHDGYIDVVTELGQGTMFSLYFPAFVTGSEAVTIPDKSLLQEGAGQTILVVEDNMATRQAVVDSLSLLKYRVIEAGNGRQALSVLTEKGEEIDLVLSDMVMPEMGGKALLQAMRQQNWSIPVVFMTGHPLGKEMEKLRALGMVGWLPKPPNLEKLSYLLAQALLS